MIRRSLWVAALLVILVALGVVAAPWLRLRDSASTAAEKKDGKPQLPLRATAEAQPEKGKIFILAIGSDARSGNPGAGADARADAIHLIGINTKKMRAGILNFPRDSWVNVPGRGPTKINEALYRGGPELVAQTVENLTRIDIDHWILTGFDGFQSAVKDVGKVETFVPRDLHDPGGSGADLRRGKQKLAGWQALAFMRDRHDFPDGDIDRSTNHGDFLIALLRKLRDDVSRNPGSLFRWMVAAHKHTRDNLSAAEMFRLGILATQLQAKDVKNVTVPVSYGHVGAASVLYIGGGADSIYRRFKKNAYL